MAVVFPRFLNSPLPHSSLASSLAPPSPRPQFFASSAPSSSSPMEIAPQKYTDFTFVSAPHRNLMVDMVSTMENRLDSQLKPCTLPSDIQYYYTPSGNSHGSLYIRSGHTSSPVDFVLGSWINCKMPTEGALNITSLSAYLNASTDAPNFLIELIQSSPTSLVFLLDLPPRKDLVLYPEYLNTFYENTRLESLRQTFEKLPEVQPYYSSALYIRCLTSPTSIMIQINTEGSREGRMEEIIKDHVHPVAKEALGIWLDRCACGHRNVDEEGKAYLEKRDGLIKNKTIEIDIGSSFPRLFGPDIANRVLEVIREAYNG
ncbi:Red chlorophyll catabolite reductase [Hibiscus syriacus]|uniref:Red chlorophyll catabolite reductase n=1 Tax=Hibiscus syriacus TaxID=106335 RepID=A0A6A2XZ21_HIBSY|nr:red chlorophyll catabolite reductase-like [Hibiscus syriacus]KAE8672605.1 Red chlorophyll catabolite reductase [Hibiscus syriacus]